MKTIITLNSDFIDYLTTKEFRPMIGGYDLIKKVNILNDKEVGLTELVDFKGIVKYYIYHL